MTADEVKARQVESVLVHSPLRKTMLQSLSPLHMPSLRVTYVACVISMGDDSDAYQGELFIRYGRQLWRQ